MAHTQADDDDDDDERANCARPTSPTARAGGRPASAENKYRRPRDTERDGGGQLLLSAVAQENGAAFMGARRTAWGRDERGR